MNLVIYSKEYIDFFNLWYFYGSIGRIMFVTYRTFGKKPFNVEYFRVKNTNRSIKLNLWLEVNEDLYTA